MWQLKTMHTWSCLISENQGSEYSWTGSRALWFLTACNQDADWGCRYLSTLKNPPGKKIHFQTHPCVVRIQAVGQSVPQFAMWVFSRGSLQYWTVCFMKASRRESEKWKSAICNLISVVPPHLGFILFIRENPWSIALTQVSTRAWVSGGWWYLVDFSEIASHLVPEIFSIACIELGFKKNWTILCQTI